MAVICKDMSRDEHVTMMGSRHGSSVGEYLVGLLPHLLPDLYHIYYHGWRTKVYKEGSLLYLLLFFTINPVNQALVTFLVRLVST